MEKPDCSSAGAIVERFRKKYPGTFDPVKPRTPEQEAELREKIEEEKRRHDMRRRQRMFRELMGQMGKRYEGVRLSNYQVSHPGQKEVVDSLRKYGEKMLEEIAAGNGIVLFGSAGTGKDHLIIAMARYAILKHGLTVQWWNGLDLYGQFRNTIGNDNQTEMGLIRELMNPDILVLSDPIPPAGQLTEFQASCLLRILDGRYRNCRPTWATLNVASGQEADERMGAPLVDRLRHGAVCGFCNWPSYRQRGGVES